MMSPRNMSHDERLAVLETTVQHTNAVLVSLVEQLRHLSDRIDLKFDQIDNRFDSMNQKFDQKFDDMDRKFEQKFDAMDRKFEQKFDAMDKKFEQKSSDTDRKFEQKFDSIDRKLEAINSRLWSNFLWLMGMIIGLAGLLAHAQHWI